MKPDFALTDDTAPLVAEICQRLDGLPLAIELAAVRVKILSLQALLARLRGDGGTRLELLKGGARDLPARQQTLRNTIDWSHELLDAEAKTLFRRLAVFAGGCTLEAVEAVCNADGQPGVDAMSREMSDGEPRFSMLETIHEYARERLAHSGEDQDLRRRHAAYFFDLVARIEPELRGVNRNCNRAFWLDRLKQAKPEYDNLRAAMAWSISAEGDRQMGLRFAGAIGLFLWLHGNPSEGRHWLDALLANREGMPHTPELARALFAAGTLAWAQGDLAVARPLLEESVAIGRELNNEGILAEGLFSLGVTLMNQGELVTAQACLQESADRFHAVHDEWGEAFARKGLGDATTMAGDFERARVHYEASVTIARTAGDLWSLSAALVGLGSLNLAHQAAATAQAHYQEGITLLRQVGDQFALAWAVSGLGFARLLQGDIERAYARLTESLTLAQAVGNPRVIILYLAGMAGVAALRDQTRSPDQKAADLRRAARLFGAADRMRRELGATLWQGYDLTIDHLLASARSQMDAAEWDAAFAEGQAMSLDQALAYSSARNATDTSEVITASKR